MKKVLMIVGIVILVLVVAVVVLLKWLNSRPLVPENYTETVETGGPIEAKYLAMGSHKVSYYEAAAFSSFKKYEIFYPSDMAEMVGPLPVVVFVNGSGALGSKYPALQKHMASWGFITIATEEEHAFFGFSAEMCVRYLESLNSNDGDVVGGANPFRDKIDLNNIGITGHSQGGVGVFNAITGQDHAGSYKAAVTLSHTQKPVAQAFLWEYDETRVQTPILMLASTGQSDSETVIPLEWLEASYEAVPDTVPKVMARRSTGDHGEMLYSGDGYVTAWFMYWLQGDEEAGTAFFGDAPELFGNRLYQDQRASRGTADGK